jgi:hypothetical protein
VTPEEDYRTALLSDSPDAGCSLSPPRWVGSGNDPAGKPAGGTPRAERRPAASFHPPGRGAVRRDANEGLLGRPEAPNSTNLTIPRRAGERRNNKNQPTKYSVAARILRDRVWNLLKLKADSTGACGYGGWVR